MIVLAVKRVGHGGMISTIFERLKESILSETRKIDKLIKHHQIAAVYIKTETAAGGGCNDMSNTCLLQRHDIGSLIRLV